MTILKNATSNLPIYIPLIAFTLYIYTAYNSSGYHHEDEHYQIIEFANYKLGLISQKDLAWEFSEHIRPGLQPFICFMILKLLNAFNIHDGYQIAFFLRLITVCSSFVVVYKFVKAFSVTFNKKHLLIFTFLSYLLWFLPYIYVRFSSETWSGIVYLLVLISIEEYKTRFCIKQLILVGLLIGFMVLFRYQSILFAAGFLLWGIIILRLKMKALLIVLSSFLLVIMLGVIIDYWLYGQITFSFFNYFKTNVIEDVASKFGVSPWYQYAVYLYVYMGFFGIIAVISLIIFIFFKRSHSVAWSLVPFIFVHCLIPHKELRFLFPLAFICPFILTNTLEELEKRIPHFMKYYTKYKVSAIACTILFLVNALGLVVICSTGSGSKRTAITSFIRKNYDEKKTNIILCGGINPYMDWGPPKNSYYSSRGLTIHNIINPWDQTFTTIIDKNYSNLLIIRRNEILGPETLKYLKSLGFVKVYANLSELSTVIYMLFDRRFVDYGIEVYELKIKNRSLH